MFFFYKARNAIYFWRFASVEALQNIFDKKLSQVVFGDKKETKQRMVLGLSEVMSWRNIQNMEVCSRRKKY